MKILLSGAQGTGKSTANNALMKVEQLREFTQIDSVSEMFATSLDTFKDPEKLLKFQLSISFYCFSRYINEDNILSSRSFADTYAYAMYTYKRNGDQMFKQLADLALGLAKIYNTKEYKYIYVPIMFPLQSKGLRSTNIEFQKEIDLLLKEFYELTNVEYLEIKSLSTDDRVQEILDYCELL